MLKKFFIAFAFILFLTNITKVNAATTGGNSTLKIYVVDANSLERLKNVTVQIKDSEGEYYGSYSTDSNGIIQIKKLSEGEITIKVVEVPEEYTLTDTEYVKEIGNNKDETYELRIEHKKGELILRSDVFTTLLLYNSDNTLMGVFGMGDTTCINVGRINTGTYTVEKKETNEVVEFTIEENEVREISFLTDTGEEEPSEEEPSEEDENTNEGTNNEENDNEETNNGETNNDENTNSNSSDTESNQEKNNTEEETEENVIEQENIENDIEKSNKNNSDNQEISEKKVTNIVENNLKNNEDEEAKTITESTMLSDIETLKQETDNYTKINSVIKTGGIEEIIIEDEDEEANVIEDTDEIQIIETASSPDTVTEEIQTTENNHFKIKWILLIPLLFIFFILILKKKKTDRKNSPPYEK